LLLNRHQPNKNYLMTEG